MHVEIVNELSSHHADLPSLQAIPEAIRARVVSTWERDYPLNAPKTNPLLLDSRDYISMAAMTSPPICHTKGKILKRGFQAARQPYTAFVISQHSGSSLVAFHILG